LILSAKNEIVISFTRSYEAGIIAKRVSSLIK